MKNLAFDRDVGVHIEYTDETPFGSPIGTRPAWSTREVYANVFAYVTEHGYGNLLRDAPSLLAETVRSPRFAQIAEVKGDRWTLDPAILYPDASRARPVRLNVMRSGSGDVTSAVIPPELWPAMHDLVASLARGFNPREEGFGDHPLAVRQAAAQMLHEFLTHELVHEFSPEELRPQESMAAAPLTFVGHNTVVVRSSNTSVVVDPWFFPASPTNPTVYQPLAVRDIGPVSAILITHTHRDHLDPASLMQFPRNVPVVVPQIEAETLLATDIGLRLRELGFTDVRPLSWNSEVTFGDINVRVLPFYGEQPTDNQVFHPEIRNAGNTYVVRTPELSAAFLADTGADHLGDISSLALRERNERGPVDVVFCGYREWRVYPVQHLSSSVASYLLFVPPELWSSRMRVMSNPHEALDAAERWGARLLLPYADGGAPWHWDLGLGPRLDGGSTDHPEEYDPPPELVLYAASRRAAAPDGGQMASPVGVRILRPGDSVIDPLGEFSVERLNGHSWPYGERTLSAT